MNRSIILSRHLLSVKKALNVGVNVFGYCSWSFMDIVSGHSGFSKRYGLVRVNREEHDLKDLARSKKKSFYWYKKDHCRKLAKTLQKTLLRTSDQKQNKE